MQPLGGLSESKISFLGHADSCVLLVIAVSSASQLSTEQHQLVAGFSRTCNPDSSEGRWVRYL